MPTDEIAELCRRMDLVEARLANVEGLTVNAPPVVVPPPFFTTYPPIRPPKIVRTPEEGEAPKPDLEYRMWAQVAPRAGAVAMILAFAYAVSYVVGKGWLTPAMLLSGICFACAAFMGTGHFIRREREQFGSILTAIGSAGLYLNLAAGHSIQNLYSGQTLVILFTLLSFANLAYGTWQASGAFVILGALGGFGGVFMPLSEHKVVPAAILHLLILIPSAFIAARFKWTDVAVAVFGLAFATIAFSDEWHALPGPAWPLLLGATVVVGVFSYGTGHDGRSRDTHGLFAPAASSAGALVMALQWPNWHGAVYSVVLGAVLVIGSLVIRDRLIVRRVQFGGLLCVPLASIALPALPASYALLVAAILMGAMSMWWLKEEGSALSAICLAFAAIGFVNASASAAWSWTVEAPFIASYEVVLVLASAFAVRAGTLPKNMVAVPIIAGAGFLARLAYISMRLPVVAVPEDAATTLCFAVASIGLGITHRIRPMALLAAGAAVFLMLGAMAYVACASEGVAPKWEIAANLSVFGSVIALAIALRPYEGPTPVAQAAALCAAWVLISRLGFVIFTAPPLRWNENAAVTLSWLLLALGLICYGFARDNKETRFAALAVLGATSIKIVVFDLSFIDVLLRVLVLGILGALMLASGYWAIRRARRVT